MERAKEKLSVERMIWLEQYLYDNYPDYLGMETFNDSDFNGYDVDYLRLAYRMPYSIVSERIDEYDMWKSRKTDLARFVEQLAREFGMSYSYEIIERIKNVRQIKKYLLERDIESRIPSVQINRTLVRDKELKLDNSDTVRYYTSELSDYDFWCNLLKLDQASLKRMSETGPIEHLREQLVDRFEIFRAMAEYLGFSIEEVTQLADIRKEQVGGYKKKMLLNRTVTKE